MSKTVVVLGKGDLAIQVAQWFHDSADHELSCVVPVIPEPQWTRSLKGWAEAAGVPTVASGRYKDLQPGADGKVADLGVSVFYDRIFDAAGIALFGRLINIHNGPLPRYRGVSPINWALKNQEIEHGVTIHEITPGIDDGPIVAQVRYSIHPDKDEVIEVYQRALRYAWLLFQDTMPLLDHIAARPQDEAQALYYSKKHDPLLEERSGFRRPEPAAG
jgi:methionyl-tRNA formyltransferase